MTREWNEEVMKWLAVGICIAMVGMAVVPVSIGDAVAYLAIKKKTLQWGLEESYWGQ